MLPVSPPPTPPKPRFYVSTSQASPPSNVINMRSVQHGDVSESATCSVTVRDMGTETESEPTLKRITLRTVNTAPAPSGSQIVLTDDIIRMLIRHGRAEVILYNN